ncbi:Acg family FMN-binding oxidoreductase [Sporomusa malonica]|nr:nitroreductase family protein [Sporomusa malonica]
MSYIQGLSKDEIEILYLASLAPSGHNTQPWTITIKGPKRWVIGSDMTRWLPAVDPDNREMMLSIGAFIENLSVAAGIQGYEAETDVIGKDNFSSEIAELRLIKGKETSISDRAIKERRTVRKHLLKSPMREEDIKYLVGNNKNTVFYYPLNSKAGSYLSEATLLANKTQVYREDAQKELAEWIRWTEQEAREHHNGLTPESMELKGIVRWYAEHFLSKGDVLSKPFRNETIKLVEEQVQNCAGWLVVKSDNAIVTELINAGRVFQSVWLRAREKLIAFHPMTQVLEEAPWLTELAKELGHTGSIQFVVRIGYVKEYLQPVSLRMPMSKIIVIESRYI